MQQEEMLRLQLECTSFFQDNPYSFETAYGLSLRLGRKPEHLTPILDKLVGLSILEQVETGTGCIYRYVEPEIIVGGGHSY